MKDADGIDWRHPSCREESIIDAVRSDMDLLRIHSETLNNLVLGPSRDGYDSIGIAKTSDCHPI
jgi:hypothetical protein